MKIDIIYEDNHILVVKKPPNILSQADSTNDLDMLTILKDDLKKRYNKQGNVYLGLLHRLDRPVGGVMVFAKTSKAASRISEQIRDKTFKKTYIAVVKEKLEKKEGRLEDYLLKDTSNNMSKVVKNITNDSKFASLEYSVLKIKNRFSMVKINLLTGRHHQIRVQFSNIGHPLVGDCKYDNNANKDCNLALWAYKIEFMHPVEKEKIEYTCEIPDIYPFNNF